MSAGRLRRIGPEAFDGPRRRSRHNVAVAFLADWCPFCRAFEPEFAALVPTPGLEVEVADLTAMDSPLWEQFHVDVVPTVVLFADGQPVFRADGIRGEGLGPETVETVRRLARGLHGRRGSSPRRAAGH